MIKRLIRMEYAFSSGIAGLTIEVNSFDRTVCIERIEQALSQFDLTKDRITRIEYMEIIE
ncbi:MAG TPA: hypothetical protein P5107_07590 [Thermotogota bacterium]|nr:hypothetical protein [Thermotogota bacterium]HRW34903.1 hypothetical protein [Thermotogota bacterium]